MRTRGKTWRRLMVALALIALLAPGLAAAETRYTGTIMAVDKAGGTIVLGDVGPWRVKDGETQITRRTIAVAASTAFVSAKRAAGAGPGGWVGEWVETALPAWQLKPGYFATVAARREDDRLTALKITVVELGEP